MKKLLFFVLLFLSLGANAQMTQLTGGSGALEGGTGGGGGGGGAASTFAPWAPATAYVLDDVVIYSDTLYRRIIGGTTATAPDADNTNWNQVGPGDVPVWDASSYYFLDAMVIYNGYFYQRIVAGVTATAPNLDLTNWIDLKINAAVNITGILPVDNGGSGLDASAAANGNLLIGNGTGFSLASVTGTANQVAVASGAGSITLSTPQDIHTLATPTFAALTIDNLFLDANTISSTAGDVVIDPVGALNLPDLTASKPLYLDGSNNVVAGNILASDVTNTPAGFISATDVQAALNELDTEKEAQGANTYHVGPGRKYTTIQSALTAIGDAASLADNQTPKTVFVDGGVYDEDLVIPGGRLISLIAVGSVVLGDGLGSNWSSTNARSITTNFLNALNFAGNPPRPALVMGAVVPSESTSTFVSQAAGWRVSGALNIAGDGSTHTIVLESTEITGIINKTSTGFTNFLARHSIFKGAVNMATAASLARIDHCQFNALVTVESYNEIINSEVRAGMTVTANVDILPPSGMFNTDFSGVFTGPANSLKIDDTTNYFFEGNGATLGGAATKVLMSLVDVSTLNGIVPIANGGTNSSTALNNDRMLLTTGGAIVEGAALTDGQFFVGATGAAPAAASITGTADQVIVTNGTNSVTLSTPQDIATTSSPTFASVTTTGNIDVGESANIKKLVYTPQVDTVVASAATTLDSSTTHAEVVPDADYTLTSTPTITAGVDGQILILHNESAFTVSLQDDSVLAGSDVYLGGASGAIRSDSMIMLIYDVAGPGWYVVSNPSQSVDGVPSVSVLSRNVSGATITKGSCVYISGFNAALIRPEISLADADDTAKSPCIGVAQSDIGNNTNGYMVTQGFVTKLNTSTYAIGDSLYLSTTPGVLTNIRPVTDSVQKVASVVRVHATQGAIIVQGAGRSNDLPIDGTMNHLTLSLLDVDNIRIDANTISSTDVDGDINLTPNGDGEVLITIPKIGSPTITTTLDIDNHKNSAGVYGDYTITDNGDGTVAVPSLNVRIRATNSDIATGFSASVPANAALALTDNSTNYIYAEYNAGAPQVVATVTERTDYNTNVYLGKIYRKGIVAHINSEGHVHLDNREYLLSERFTKTDPFAQESGGIISETGTRNIGVTAGVFWQGTHNFSTTALDTSVTDTFRYYYKDGVGGYTEVLAQTQIDNLNYDDGSGTLAALTTNRYGVHWVYLETDSHLSVVYGLGDYTLAQAQAAQPDGIPPEVSAHGFIAGKIIVQQGSATFFSINSAFDLSFTGTGVTDHNDLTTLQGGAASQYYHLDATEFGFLDGQNQAVLTTSSPTFVGVTLSGVTASEFLKTDGASGITSVASIDLTADVGASILPVANGGTNSSAALGNGRVVHSVGGALVENAALKTNTVSAALDVDSTVGAFMPPRMTTVQRDLLTAAAGMVLYNVTINQVQYYNGTGWISY